MANVSKIIVNILRLCLYKYLSFGSKFVCAKTIIRMPDYRLYIRLGLILQHFSLGTRDANNIIKLNKLFIRFSIFCFFHLTISLPNALLQPVPGRANV